MGRFKEPLKTALLVLLTLSALFLAIKGNLFGGLFPGAAPETTEAPEAEALRCAPAAMPASAALTGESGLHYGVKYDAGEMARLFDRCSPLLAEALGSAEEPGLIREADWRECLQGAGLFLDYGFPLPVSVLGSWVGAEVPWAGAEVGWAFLLDRDRDDGVRLSFSDGEGRFFRCVTAAAWSSLEALLEETLPNGAEFAFALPELSDCDPYLLLPESLPELRSALGAGDQAAAAAALAEEFGIHLGGQSRYTEADGTVVYPGENGVLRLEGDGSLQYSPAAGAVQTGTGAMSEQIETVRRLLETVHEAYGGEETLALTGASAEGERTVLSFGYLLNGIAVQLASGPAATAVWGPDGLRELTLLPRRYLRSEAISGLLPEKQAAAAAGSLYPGSAVRLILSDRGERRLSLGWAVTLEGRLLWTQED